MGGTHMVHFGLGSLLLCAVTTLGPVARVAAQAARQDYLVERLRDTVNFEGFNDPRTTLQDALDYLRDRYDLTYVIDETAFPKGKAKELKSFLIAENDPVPTMTGVPLDAVLGTILSRLPAEAQPTFLIQRRGIVIMSKKAASKLVLGDESKPLPPLVHAKYDNLSLQEALSDIANHTDVNVVMDDSVAKKAGQKVSALFINTPVDTAVRILADRHNFASLRMDNAIYVTTRENAAKLSEEIERDKNSRDKCRWRTSGLINSTMFSRELLRALLSAALAEARG